MRIGEREIHRSWVMGQKKVASFKSQVAGFGAHYRQREDRVALQHMGDHSLCSLGRLFALPIRKKRPRVI